MRWILNNVPSVVIGAVMVGGTVGITALISRSVHRRGLTLGEDSPALEPFIGIVGAVYGIILAFVIVDLWTNYHEARATVSQEATRLAQVVVDVRPLEEKDQSRIENAVSGYLDAVVNDEWQQLQVGRESPRAHDALDHLALVMEGAELRSNADQVWYAEAVTNFNQVVEARRVRLEAVTRHMPGPFRVLLFAGALVPIGSMLLLSVRHRWKYMLMVSSIALLVSYTLFLSVILDYPFSGTVSVSTAPFHQGVLAPLAP